MKLDNNARYRETHEWVKKDGDFYVCGISDHAQDALGDIVFVELPEIGKSFEQGEVFGVVESVKAASDVYMPMSGKIVEVNSLLESEPALVNQDPYEKAWFFKFSASDEKQFDSLLTPEAYKNETSK